MKIHKNNKKVSQITNIPISTIRNWNLGYCTPARNTSKIHGSMLKEIENLLMNERTISQISKELKLPHNKVFLTAKKNFPEYYKKILAKRHHKLTKRQRKMSPELAYILGVMFGDGYNYGRNKSYCTALGVIDRDFRDNFARLIEKWSGKKPAIAEYVKRGILYYTCILYSKDVGDLILNHRSQKDVPNEILSSHNQTIKIMFIRGFTDSEGGVMRGGMGIFNKNRLILENIMKMLISLGFDKKLMHINCDKKGVHCLLISGKDNLKLFEKRIKFSIKRKQEKLRAAAGI